MSSSLLLAQLNSATPAMDIRFELKSSIGTIIYSVLIALLEKMHASLATRGESLNFDNKYRLLLFQEYDNDTNTDGADVIINYPNIEIIRDGIVEISFEIEVLNFDFSLKRTKKYLDSIIQIVNIISSKKTERALIELIDYYEAPTDL